MAAHPLPNLKKRRKEKGLKQRDLAKMIDVTQTQISYYESGKTQPGPLALSRIADVLETSTDYLIGRINDPQPIASIKVALNEYSINVAKLFNSLNVDQQYRFYEVIIEMYQNIKLHEALEKD